MNDQTGLEKKIVTRNWGLIAPDNLDEYLAQEGFATFRRALNSTPQAIIAEIENSGLRGRGDGGSPTGTKWRACSEAPSSEKYLIGNFTEGDQEAGIVKAILENDCFTVLEGLLIGAYAVGASQAIIVINRTNQSALAILNSVLQQMAERNLVGSSILGSDFSLTVELMAVDDEMLYGQESILLRVLEGKAPVNVQRADNSPASGYRDQPTLVNCAETLANIPMILHKGAEWFKGIGTQSESGNLLWQITGNANNPGAIAEVPLGTKLSDLIVEVGRGVSGELKAVLMGGPLGVLLPPDKLDLSLDFASLQANGALMGSRLITVLNMENCLVEVVRRCFERSQTGSCGKCVLCRLGTRQVKAILDDITVGRGKTTDVALLQELGEGMESGANCEFGRAAANPILSGLTYFSEEFDLHLKRKRCPALVCKGYITYHILGEKCQGCSECLDRCPVEAIEGEDGYIHVIDQDLCTQCGTCYTVCTPRHSAITKAGALKPRTPEKPVRVGSWKRR